MIRPYTKADYGYLEHALLDAGFTHKQMTFETDYTFITELGFFSYRFKSGIPYPCMGHFYVNKQNRSFKTALTLLRCFKRLMLSKGFLFFVAEAPKELPYMNRVIKFLGGLSLRKTKESNYYLAPLFKREKRI